MQIPYNTISFQCHAILYISYKTMRYGEASPASARRHYNPKFSCLYSSHSWKVKCVLMSYPASDKIMNHLGQIWFDSEACIVFRRWKRWIYQPTLGLRFQMTRWAFLGSFSATSTRPLSAGSFHCGRHTALRNRFGCHDMLSPANDYCSPHLGPLPPSLPPPSLSSLPPPS